MRGSFQRVAKEGLILTSDHVNYLVFRYLQEAGFSHTAFTFAHESNVVQATLDPNSVAPGSLIAILQKGLQFLELEANLDGQDGDVDGDFKLLAPEELLTNDPDTLRKLVQDRREEENTTGRGGAAEKKRTSRRKDEDKGRAGGGRGAAAGASPQLASRTSNARLGPEPMDEDKPGPLQPIELLESSVTDLQGHDGTVYTCAWHQSEQLLASGGSDGTARIWNVSPSGHHKCTVLAHDFLPGRDGTDVTCVEWSPDGSLLATSATDGQARIWTREGKLKHVLSSKSTGCLFTVKWNKKGDMLAGCTVDGMAVVWDARTGELKHSQHMGQQGGQQGSSQAALDIDWKTNAVFAVCSGNAVYVVKVGDREPMRKWSAHTGDVNALRWDPSGHLLASGSDDHTVRIWSFKSSDIVHTLSLHTAEITVVRWAPTSQPALLASASFDLTVRLWDAESGACLHTLSGQYVSFSASARWVATGLQAGPIHVYGAGDGALARSHNSGAEVFDLAWSPAGDRIAVCLNTATVRLLDVKL